MPRRPAMPDNYTNSPPPSISNIALLRQQWKWAAFSQFFYTFSPLFAMSDVTLNDIERDLIHATSDVLPRIMHRLLYTLSYDRKVSIDNWQTALRKQYNKRDPQANLLGPEPKVYALSNQDENIQHVEGKAAFQVVDTPALTSCFTPHTGRSDDRNVKLVLHHQILDENDSENDTSINWLHLPMLSKLESMHTLIEWQFQHPTRLRNIMKSDDESALWRIEPVGYDSKRNAYWFIGNRLWIQRTPPKPTKPLKRKRTPQIMASAKRPRLTGSTTQHSNWHATHPQHSTRRSRAAKDQAMMKLDVQARDLANLNRQAALLNQESTTFRPTSLRSQHTEYTSRPLGTRISARLRGSQKEEWQSVPKEWLNEERSLQDVKTEAELSKTGLESDEDAISDLTELSEEVSDDSKLNTHSLGENFAESPALKHRETSGELQMLDTYAEWETICTTLEEWEHFSVRFENATHYTEKSLYKVLSRDIVPTAIQELREIERKCRLEEAFVHRKRSSRIASKESEREEARLTAKKKQEDEEKHTRARRMEARLHKEEAARLKRERAREHRRKEREAREQSAKAVTSNPERQREDAGSSTSHRSTDYPRDHKIEGELGLSRSSTRTPVGDWELCCEICHRQGVNIDDGAPMMSCASCSKWQHILCHNERDLAAGHPPRNWDSVEFICQRCRAYQLDGSGANSVLTTKQRTLQHSDTLQAAESYTIPDTRQPSGSFPRGQEGLFRGSYDRRPNGVGQTLSTQGHFLSSTLFSTSDIYDPPSVSTPRHTKAIQSRLTSRLWESAAASYKPQTPINVAPNTEHSAAQNGYPEVVDSSQYKHRPNKSLRRHQLDSSTSATPGYPSHQHYPTSFQPPLGK